MERYDGEVQPYRKRDYTPMMVNNIVDHINNTKCLGVIIDRKLNWAAHILYIKGNIYKSIGILLNFRQ